ncbi:hypothetical protein GWN65_01925 [Candidatus Bathyarchaeota archaeon]|nr:hypothetical protein [Candidatus Bathyarchaeota archaeon]NIV43759.1 hypothetical protein [Candidatus Bathyarchaeota archaeon]
METEELFLIFASLMMFFDLIQLSKAKPREKRKLEYSFYATTLACGLIVASYLMLVQAFLNDDFLLTTVYSYSASGLSLASKFYATWGGASSSMLFLTFLTGLFYFAYRFMTFEKRSAYNIATYKILDFILIFFLIVTLMNSPFERLPAAPMDGKGLNPLLQTFWMFAHPPVIFAGYVFVILAFALSLASMSTKESGNDRLLRISLIAAWLTTTLGIALGGLWAYEVLGWGGYWAWDPVETASLLPWLALTAYFHLGAVEKRKSLARELMILVAFVTVIFATSLTRGGLLVSVHAFGISPIGPILLLFGLALVIYFFALKRRIKSPLYSFHVERSSLFSVSLFLGFWSLIFLLLVSFWGIAFPLVSGLLRGVSQSTSAEFYNNWSFPFALAFVAALIGCSTHEKVGLKKFGTIVAASLATGVILVQLGWPTPNVLSNLGIPLLIVALSAVTYRLFQVLLRKKRSFRLFGRGLLHLAIVVTLIGVFASSAAKQVSGEILATPNTTISALGLDISLQDFTIYNGTGNVHSMSWQRCVPEYSALKLDIVIQEGGITHQTALWIRYYTLYGIVSPPSIITTWTGDIYIRMLHTESMSDSLIQALANNQVLPEDLYVTVEKSPLIYLVWTGVAIMSAGITMALITELVKYAPKETQVD